MQVFQVRKKDTGQIYAMKVMRKEKVLEKEHGEYVRAESEILKTVLHPYIVTLRYSFQVHLYTPQSPCIDDDSTWHAVLIILPRSNVDHYHRESPCSTIRQNATRSHCHKLPCLATALRI